MSSAPAPGAPGTPAIPGSATVAASGGDVVVVGQETTVLRDLYHAVLRARWSVALLGLTGVFLVLNLFFAVLYMELGGVAHARHHSLSDAFFFSVQTMGTIGYGAMYPETAVANTVVVVEAVTSLVVTAMATGLVFAKFSRSNARVVFTSKLVISPMQGVPTLAFRAGNRRGNLVVEAQLRLALVRTEHPPEGGTFYRMVDLELTRDRSPAFSRSWTVMHQVKPGSPLWGMTPEQMQAEEVEIMASLNGLDETSMQALHARHRWYAADVVWGARHVDVLSELPDGRLLLDLRKFDAVEPTQPTEAFPYPRPLDR
ncbi:MAG: ATP-sensitive inward rectifier potassium channel 10 [Deltaproteobacteria bacterium]|nr:ATP-sensitive inward rectifier potassium channel 10 [Deltaproteobacteria bacterium]